MSDQKFFVVRTWVGRPSYSIEHGDFSGRYAKNEYQYRAEVTGTDMTLDQLIAAYERGWRAKTKPVTKP